MRTPAESEIRTVMERALSEHDAHMIAICGRALHGEGVALDAIGMHITARPLPEPAPVSVPVPSADFVARFWAKVNKDGPTMAHMETPCWVWMGAKPRGYGVVAVGLTTRLAHRVSMMIAGVDPGDDLVCHTCDNKACVRPDHLYVGTHADNNKDTTNRHPNPGRGRPPLPEGAGRTERVSVLLTPAQVRLLDELRGAESRSSYLARRGGLTLG